MRRWRLIAKITAGTAVASVIISLLLPIYFQAETKILPPPDKGTNLAAQLMGQAGGLIALAGGAGSVKSQGDMLIGMLESRTVLDRMVDRFDLMKLYGKKFRQDARRSLTQSMNAFEDRNSGIITLTVEDQDPKRAAEMANAFVEELRTLAGGLSVSEAGQRRLFFEDQIRRTKVALARSEEDVRDFQQRTGMFQVDAQAKAIIEGIARLRAAVAAKEVEAKVLRSFATVNNPDLQRTEDEIRALQAELAKIETGKGRGFDPLMSSERVPELGTEYLRKIRQLKYNETLYELLAKQYELARLEESREAIVIQVVDKAIPPERKFRPKRALIVVLSTAMGFLLSCLLVLFLERPGRKPEAGA